MQWGGRLCFDYVANSIPCPREIYNNQIGFYEDNFGSAILLVTVLFGGSGWNCRLISEVQAGNGQGTFYIMCEDVRALLPCSRTATHGTNHVMLAWAKLDTV